MSATWALAALLGALIGWVLLPLVREFAPYDAPARPLTRAEGACVAALTGAAAPLGGWLVGERGWAAACAAVFGVLGVVASVVDVRTMRLPDVLTGPLAVVVIGTGLTGSALAGDWSRFAEAGRCAVVLTAGLGALWLCYPGGVGLGDVKLAPSAGFVAGLAGGGACVAGLFAALVLAAAVGVVAKVRAGRGAGRTMLPFGPFMVLGAGLALGVGEGMWQAYATLAGLA